MLGEIPELQRKGENTYKLPERRNNYLKRKMDQTSHRQVICHRGKNKAAENHVQNIEK